MVIKQINYILLLMLILTGCSDDTDPSIDNPIVLSSAKEILDFKIDNIETEIDGDIVKLYVSASENNFNYNPLIKISENAKISPDLSNSIDFSNPVTIKIIAQDGSSKTYTTELITKEGVKEISLVFKSGDDFLTNKYLGTINELDKTIKIAYSGYIANSAAGFDYLPFLEIKTIGNVITSPTQDDIIDLSKKDQKFVLNDTNDSYNLLIQNEDNKIKNLKLPITTMNIPRSSQDASFAFPEFSEGLTEGDHIIYTLKNQNLTNLIPDYFHISEYATIDPSTTLPQDFTKDVNYTITSETGNSISRKVRVIEKNVLFYNDTNNSFSSSDNPNFFNYYKSTSKIVAITLVNIDTNETLGCEIIQNYETTDNEMYLSLKAEKMPLQEESYFYRCTLEEGITVDTYGRINLNPN